MSEQNLRKCNKCNQLKQRILTGKFDDKNKKYQDESGKTWAGSVCPPCHKERMRINMKVLRTLKK